MNEFFLQVWLGKQLFAEHKLVKGNDITVGSGSDCDILLSGDRIADLHVKFVWDIDILNIVAVDGEVRIAGKVVSETAFDQTSVASIGPYLIKLTVTDADTDTDTDTDTDDGGLSTDNNKKIDSVKSENTQKKLLLGEPLSSYVQWQKIASLFSGEHRTKMILGLTLFILLSFFLLSGGDNEETTVVDKQVEDKEQYEAVNQRLDESDRMTQREILRYQQWGSALIEEGKYAEAMVPLRTATQRFTQNQKLTELYVSAIQNFVSESEQDKNYEHILATLEPLQADHPLIKNEFDRIQALQTEQELFQQRMSQLQGDLDTLQIEVEKLYAEEAYQQAETLLNDFPVEQLPADSSMKAMYSSMLTKIQGAIKEQERLAALARDQYQRDVETFNQLFTQCLQLQETDFMLAYQKCREASALNITSVKSEELRIWLDFLEASKNMNLQLWNARAENCFSNEEVRCALDYWQRMIEFGHEGTAERLQEVIAIQRAKAEELYKEAQAYRDLGRPHQARRSLRRLKEILPIDSEVFYQRADELLSIMN